MPDQLQIGRLLALPIDAVTYTTAILGTRGTGKTNTATVFVEEAYRHGQRSVILDPLDVWWGLKSSADGQSEGLQVVIFGGDHQDLPLERNHGALVAEMIAKTGITAVLSTAHLRKNAQKQFACEFFEHLYHLKAQTEYRDRLLIAIDEASSFAPQTLSKAGGGEMDFSARCLGAVEDLVRRGRSRGIGVVLIDQRAASVNKNILTQLEILITHRQTSPQDRKAIHEWVQATEDGDNVKDLLATLAVLGRGEGMQGEAWVWSPLLGIFERVQIRMRETFDSSRTPGPGEAAAVPSRMAHVEMEALRAQFSEFAEAREEGHEKPKENSHASEAEIAREVAVATKRLQERNDELEWIMGELREVIQRMQAILALEAEKRDDSSLVIPAEFKAAPAAQPAPTPQPTSRPKRAPSGEPGSSQITPAQQRILNAIRSFEALGIPSPSRAHVANFADVSPRSSSYGNNLSRLNVLKLIYYSGQGEVGLTDAGRELAVQPEALPNLKGLHDAWRKRLRPAQAALLNILIARYPKSVARESLATEAGKSAKSSAFGNDLSRLSSLGLVRYPDKGMVVATDLLFPKGLK